MGVESDRLVFDYLSRVGDLAQTAMPAAQRMQLVAQLRKDIERETRGADSAAAVQRVLGRIGSPDDVVEAAAEQVAGRASRSGSAAPPPPAQEPPPGSYGPYAKPPGGGRVPRPGRLAQGRTEGAGAGGLSGGTGGFTGGTGGFSGGAEWWQGDGRGGLGSGEELVGLPGMTGGIFIPVDDEDLDAAGRPLAKAAVEEAEDDAEAEEVAEEVPAGARPRRRLLPRMLRAGGAARGWGSPVLLLAAALLLAGAAIGSLIPLGLGWLTAWLSRRLSRPQAKFAVLVIPGAFAAGMLVWIWGRDVGKWGDPIAQGQVGQAFQDTYPLTVRLAAVGTALYLLWRSRRSA